MTGSKGNSEFSFPVTLNVFIPPTIEFVIPPHSNTFSDWRRTGHVSLVKTSYPLGRTKLTNSLEKQQFEISDRLWSVLLLKPRQISVCARRYKAKDSSFFFLFWLGVITKHLMTGPAENCEFCFPPTSMCPGKQCQEPIGCWQNLMFSLGPVIRRLIQFLRSK